jgi:general secretion pathway protein D
MRRIARLFVVSLFAVVCLQTFSAEAAMADVKSAPQVSTSTVRNHPRLARRAARRCRAISHLATPVAHHLDEAKNGLPVRVYHLTYVKSEDMAAIIKMWLSAEGTVTATSPKILVVQDGEERLKTFDGVVEQLDVEPPAVLIEAQLIRVNLNHDHARSGVNFAFLADAKKSPPLDVGKGKINGVPVQFRPASAVTPARDAAKRTPAESGGVKFGFIGDNTAGFVRRLERFGEPAMLAAPRLLVLNKQSADVSIGHALAYQETIETPTATIEKPVSINIGTELHVRPFVSSDRMVRLEVNFSRTTGGLDSQGIPQTDTEQIQTNVLIPDGTSVVACGSVRAGFIRLFDLFPSLRSIPYLNRLLYDVKWFTGNEQLVVLLSAKIANH